MGNMPQRRRVVGTGLTVMDRIYTDGVFVSEELGGSCGNVLLSLAMLRHEGAPLITLGMDAIGGRLVKEFASAGADVSHIRREMGRHSPVITQEVDTVSSRHSFSFICIDTLTELPRYWPIEPAQASAAATVLTSCALFYADRLSPGILEAMTAARTAGAVVYFEPSDIDDVDLFDAALELTTILKYSADRLGPELDAKVCNSPVVAIVTHGELGLEIRRQGSSTWSAAVSAVHIADTCGAGDMVSVGLIDWMLDRCAHGEAALDGLVNGVLAGQRLAAANCAYIGARGVFIHAGPEQARRVLAGAEV